jgi:hypothetical protein
MKSRSWSIFRHAQVYERAARLLNAAGTSDPALLLPSMVNAALSLELYFKSLYVLDRGAEFKVKGRHSHDFAALFEELQEPTKEHLLAQFNTALSARNTNDIRMVESSLNMVVPQDLKENLVQWASIFVDLRYAYDFIETYKGEQKTMMFFPEIRDSVYNAIIGRESTWKS